MTYLQYCKEIKRAEEEIEKAKIRLGKLEEKLFFGKGLSYKQKTNLQWEITNLEKWLKRRKIRLDNFEKKYSNLENENVN